MTRLSNGKEYLVVPVTMMVPGVLNGSKGPLYYPAEEIVKEPSKWNGVPVTLNHPMHEDKPVSASDPTAIDHILGHIENARIKKGNLVAEAWLDVANVTERDKRILTRIGADEPIELSTGLNLTQDEKSGEFNGRVYNAIARDYKPDHLAILPDQVGACSIQDGCGVLINEDLLKSLTTKAQQLFPGEEVSVVNVDKELYYAFRKSDNSFRLIYPESKVDNKESTDVDKQQKIDYIVANCGCWSKDDVETLNAMDDAKLDTIKKHVEKNKQNEAVANAAKAGFEAGDTGTYTFNMENGQWDHTPATPKEPVVNTSASETQPPTDEEWLASAPPAIQSVVRNAMAQEAAQKKAAIEAIVANKANTLKEEVLNTMSLDQLQGIAALAAPAEETPAPGRAPVNYRGNAAPSASVNNGGKEFNEEDDVLELPTVNWNE